MSRRLIITLDEELSEVLAKYPNQADVVRNALRLYLYDITTEKIQGFRVAFKQLLSGQEDIKVLFERLLSKLPDQ